MHGAVSRFTKWFLQNFEKQDEAAGGGSRAPAPPVSTTSVTDIPDELLQLCFARLPVRFLHSVRAVCRRWRRLGHAADHLRALRRSLGVTEQWTVVLANGFGGNEAFRGLQGRAHHRLSSESTSSSTGGGTGNSSNGSSSGAGLPIRTLRTPHRVLFGAAAGTHGIVYVLGGRSPLISGKPDEWEVFARVDAYDPLRNCWAPAPPMLTPRYGFAAGAFVDPVSRQPKVIVAGGYDAHGQALADAEVLDVCGAGWERIPSMPRLRGACRGRVFGGGCVVVMQAYADHPGCVEEYDPLEKRWNVVAAGGDRLAEDSSNGCTVVLNV